MTCRDQADILARFEFVAIAGSLQDAWSFLTQELYKFLKSGGFLDTQIIYRL